MLKRFLKGVWSFHRLPEIGACRKATPQWIRLTACYLGFPITLPFEIQLATGPFYFETIADVRTFWQIFLGRIYEVRRSDRLIVDAGANIGAFTVYALMTAPQARVISIEPGPDSCDRIRRLLRAHGFEHRCTLHQAALGGQRGVTSLNMDAGSQFRATGAGGVQVDMVTLDEVVAGRVDLLKMDIEGAEYETLSAASLSTLRSIQRVAMEYHPNRPLSAVASALEPAGLALAGVREEGGGYGLAYWKARPLATGL
jgi:FkbM family methyltransferase